MTANKKVVRTAAITPLAQMDLTQHILRFLSTIDHFRASCINKHFRKVCSIPSSYTNGFKMHAHEGEKMPPAYARLGWIQGDFENPSLVDQESAIPRKISYHDIPENRRDFVLSLVRVVTVFSDHTYMSFKPPNVRSLNFWHGNVANVLSLARSVKSITVQGKALATFGGHSFPKLQSLVLRKPYSSWDHRRMPAKLVTLASIKPSSFPSLQGIYVTETENWHLINNFPQVTFFGVRGQSIPDEPLLHVKYLHIYAEEKLTEKFLTFFPNLKTLACHDEVLPDSFRGEHVSLDSVAPNKLPDFPPDILCGMPSIWAQHWEKFEDHFKSIM